MRSGTAPPQVFDEDYPPLDDDVAEAAPLTPITGSLRLADLFRSRRSEPVTPGAGTVAGAPLVAVAEAGRAEADESAGTGEAARAGSPAQASPGKRDPLVDTWSDDGDAADSLPIYSVIADNQAGIADNQAGIADNQAGTRGSSGPDIEATVNVEPFDRLPDDAGAIEGEPDDGPGDLPGDEPADTDADGDAVAVTEPGSEVSAAPGDDPLADSPEDHLAGLVDEPVGECGEDPLAGSPAGGPGLADQDGLAVQEDVYQADGTDEEQAAAEADDVLPFPVQDDADLDFEPYRPDPHRPVYGQQRGDR
jgi:hypothetical protein